MGAPIRVAHVMGKMVGGGVEQVVMNYYRHIDRSRVQFDFLVDADSTLVPRGEIESLGGRVFEIPPYQHPVAYQRALVSLFRNQGWKIVHSHINALSVFPLRAAKRAGVPVRIAHSHSTSGKGEPARNAIKWILRCFSRLYPTDLAACGQYAGEWLFGNDSDFTVFQNAIDLNRFAFDMDVRNCVRTELDIPAESFVIGHLGRFVTQKNHAFLLRAFAGFLERRSGSMLVLAGDGPLLNQMRDLAEALGILGNVRFLGRRGDAERLYQAFDAFALPSIYEGFCVVGVEAQAAGLPCLFSDAVSLEVGLSSAVRFIPLVETAWVNALEGVYSVGWDRSMSDGIRAYEIADASGRLLSYYERLISRTGEL